ncbi:hypothetical protein B0H14DRAFT_2587181 [Mycena olivaceomarginata]|nr:hypothetical protein B0H14DRAFT_2587181 [Mycena olivaceomarginata]
MPVPSIGFERRRATDAAKSPAVWDSFTRITSELPNYQYFPRLTGYSYTQEFAKEVEHKFKTVIGALGQFQMPPCTLASKSAEHTPRYNTNFFTHLGVDPYCDDPNTYCLIPQLHSSHHRPHHLYLGRAQQAVWRQLRQVRTPPICSGFMDCCFWEDSSEYDSHFWYMEFVLASLNVLNARMWHMDGTALWTVFEAISMEGGKYPVHVHPTALEWIEWEPSNPNLDHWYRFGWYCHLHWRGSLVEAYFQLRNSIHLWARSG